MILSHARLPIPTLPREAELATDDTTGKVNQKLTTDTLEDFLKSRRQGISSNTVLFYQRCLAKAIGIDLTSTGINWFLSTSSCKNGRFAYYRAIRALCNWLHRQGYLEDNPIRLVDSQSIAKKILPSATEEQLDILLKAADSQRDKCIVSLLFYSGLRLSELCDIKPIDMDWSNNTIKVVVEGNREAKAAFTARTATFLQEYLITNGNDSLFGMKPRGIQDVLKRLSQKAGFPCNAHSFRRGFACHLHKRGLSTLSIRNLGRWSSLDMVTRYIRSITFDDCLKLCKEVTKS